MPKANDVIARPVKRWPWIIVIVLSGLVIIQLFLILVSFLPAQRLLGGYQWALSSATHEIFLRDFERAPDMLHILSLGVDSHSPVPGVVVHGVALDPFYKKDKYYLIAISYLSSEYNLITLGQTCHLALDGEDSPRIRYVLKMAELLYRGSYESKLLAKLDDLQRGDESVRDLFVGVKSHGLGMARGIPQEVLLRSISDSVLRDIGDPVGGPGSVNPEPALESKPNENEADSEAVVE